MNWFTVAVTLIAETVIIVLFGLVSLPVFFLALAGALLAGAATS